MCCLLLEREGFSSCGSGGVSSNSGRNYAEATDETLHVDNAQDADNPAEVDLDSEIKFGKIRSGASKAQSGSVPVLPLLPPFPLLLPLSLSVALSPAPPLTPHHPACPSALFLRLPRRLCYPHSQSLPKIRLSSPTHNLNLPSPWLHLQPRAAGVSGGIEVRKYTRNGCCLLCCWEW